MDELIEQCRKLNQPIIDSKEYQSFIIARNSIKSNEELYGNLMEFKRKYEDVMKYTEGNPFDEIHKLYYDNDELIHNSTVNEYLRAESALSRLVKKIIAEITEGVNI